ncbi:hypothetical protein SSX86_009290 [Deinandra increscens subsp. villosa]|uniref:Two-component response regulator n=1 Tax=Deinandra increscens subsp. villosa TaxID=3103831 RepID=A0AAP0H7P1_9ASTR
MSNSAGSGSVSDEFPAGLRVLVVDDDPVCLMIIEKMLKICNYQATVCNKARIGLALLRENKNGFDIVLSDVHMPDMDGFKLLEHIGLEMDLPVIMMSADDNQSLAMKGLTHGACYYMIKPIRIDMLRNIWQHVYRRKKKKLNGSDPLTSPDDVNHHQKVQVPEDAYYASSENGAHKWKNAKRRKDYEDESDERESSSKKPRVVWTPELHRRFVEAFQHIGIDKAVPKNILELMNVPGLTRENIASHLQASSDRESAINLQDLLHFHEQRLNESQFMGTMDPGYDLRALSVRGQLPGQSLAAVLGGSSFSRSQHLLHGSSTNMESRQLLRLQQPYDHHSFTGVNSQVYMPMAGHGQGQSQGQGQGQGQSQHVFPNGIGSNVSGGRTVPSFNLLNQIRPDSGSQNMTFSDLLAHSSPKKTEPATSFAVVDETGTQDDLLTAILEPPQEGFGQVEDEFGFDGYDLDDLPGSP